MKIESVLSLLKVLPVQKEKALKFSEVLLFWTEDNMQKEESRKRKLHRHLNALEELGMVVVFDNGTGKNCRYYKSPEKIASLFMSEEMALSLCLADSLLKHTLLDAHRLRISESIEIAESTFIGARHGMRRLRKYLRIVPDGIGRLWAKINADFINAAIEGIANGRQLDMEYVSASGNLSVGRIKPLGMVLKDGTIYLICRKGIEANVRNLPMQRFSRLELSCSHFDDSFDLDSYIDSSHQLAHLRDGASETIDLELHVAKEALFHFKERPLSVSQFFEPLDMDGKWFRVVATIPDTVMLVPWIISMGENVKIVRPIHIRQEVAEKVIKMAKHYSE